MKRVVRLGDDGQNLHSRDAARGGGDADIRRRRPAVTANSSAAPIAASSSRSVALRRPRVNPELRPQQAPGARIDVQRKTAFIDQHRRDAQQFERVGHAAGARAGEHRSQRGVAQEMGGLAGIRRLESML